MSKKTYTEFTCDNCGKKITIIEGDGFPYNDKWIYFFKIEGKYARSKTTIATIRKQDTHFCSRKCALKCLGYWLEVDK